MFLFNHSQFFSKKSTSFLSCCFFLNPLQKYRLAEYNMYVAFSAASNVTGILTDTVAVAELCHKYGALSFWDYATGGPYLNIDMNPTQNGWDTFHFNRQVFRWLASTKTKIKKSGLASHKAQKGLTVKPCNRCYTRKTQVFPNFSCELFCADWISDVYTWDTVRLQKLGKRLTTNHSNKRILARQLHYHYRYRQLKSSFCAVGNPYSIWGFG